MSQWPLGSCKAAEPSRACCRPYHCLLPQTHLNMAPTGALTQHYFSHAWLTLDTEFQFLGVSDDLPAFRITARFFLVSPQRLVPPYMLGMLRIAMPLRGRCCPGPPQPWPHWGTEKKRSSVNVLIVSQLKVR